MKTDYPVEKLCEALDISSSGYYGWRERQEQPGLRAQEDRQLGEEIERILVESRGTYGSPRIHRQLCQEGWRHGRKRVARLMRQRGLCARARAVGIGR